MEKHNSKLRRRWAEARAVWDESALRSQTELSKLYKFAHFCVMVWRSFTRNRCPVRASALAYASLLALIPMLAVVMSITSTFLKKEGEERIDEFIVKMVATMTPPAMLTTNVVAVTTHVTIEEIGRGSGREKGEISGGGGSLKKKKRARGREKANILGVEVGLKKSDVQELVHIFIVVGIDPNHADPGTNKQWKHTRSLDDLYDIS